MDIKHQVPCIEKELFRLVSKGNKRAFSEVYDHFEPRLFAFVFRMSRSKVTAEEIIQEIFIKIWLNRTKLAKIDNPGAYVYAMATNATFNYLKKEARGVALAEQLKRDAVTCQNSTEDVFDFYESRMIIMRAVEQMPTQRRTIYLMSREQGLTNQEIAKEIKISPYTVRNHLAEALRTLRKLFGKRTIAVVLFLISMS
ncbi:MAG: RNA polymerase sigma-70 factor [Cyclobacteriaceae bacterium]|nr:RNA polymerase sigma-70 factor [Cyclobacteriaceae bacterium]